MQDLETLKEKFHVTDCFIRSFNDKLKAVLSVPKHDIVFAWFGSFDFFFVIWFARLLGKKVYIVGAGYDIARVPQLGYGAFYDNYFKMLLRRKMFLMADKVLGISNVSFFEAYFFAKIPFDKIEVIDLAFDFDTDKIKLPNWNERKNRVVTVSSANEDGFFRKGVFKYLQVANLMPETEFLLIGKVPADLKSFIEKNFPPNIKLLGFVNDADLIDLVKESKVALQLSVHESFGASIIEAAILGCYPIVSSEYSLPEVADGPGARISHNFYDDICMKIRATFASEQNAEEISKYYREKYPLQKRKDKLLKLID